MIYIKFGLYIFNQSYLVMLGLVSG